MKFLKQAVLSLTHPRPAEPDSLQRRAPGLPVLRFHCAGVRDPGPVVPLVWLRVIGIIDFSGGIDRWGHILQQASLVHNFLINEYFKCIIRIQH